MALSGEELGGFNDGQVAIDTDARQEEDAGVKSGFLHARYQFAHKGAKHPMIVVKVNSPERESQRKEQISNSQVHEVNVGGRPVVFHEIHYKYHHRVPQQAEEEDYDVDNHENCAVEILCAVGARWLHSIVYVIQRRNFHV